MITDPIYISLQQKCRQLPDSGQWINRFEYTSSSSRKYIISQHANSKHFACSCRGWTTHRKCKHLAEFGLPANEVPYEFQLGTEHVNSPAVAPRKVTNKTKKLFEGIKPFF
jgi:hypothetical protein